MAADSSNDRTHDPLPAIPARRSSQRRRGAWKLLLVCGVLAALAWGGISLALNLGSDEERSGALTYTVARKPLQVTVTAEGNVESASNVEVKCRVAGGSTILWIVEDGKVVKAGDEIVRLDTAAIDDKLNSQRIVYEKALASHIQAEQDLEAAKIAVKEYEEGTFVEQLKQVEAEIQIALENLRSAENQLKYSKKMVRKGFVSSLQRQADEFAVERAKLDLDVAQTRKKVLVEFTKTKTLKDLVAAREASAARLRSEQASLQLEKDRLDRLREQLKHCVIKAPKDGMVVYANERSRSRFGSRETGEVEEGAMVRESQELVQLPDLSKMQVKVTVHESRVDQVRPGLPARIVIQDQEYSGSVLSVANQPERASWYSAAIKEYATVVTINGEGSALKPGMTAHVTILIDDVSDALSVPVSSVVEQRGKFYCWVKGPDGPERRPLKLGVTNDKLIQVVDGVKEGEVVLRNPRAVVEEAREEPPYEEQGRVSPFDLASEADSGGPSGAPANASFRTERGGRPPGEGLPGGAGPRGEGPRGEGGGGEPPRDERRGRGGGPGRGKRGGGRGFDLMQYDKDGDGKVSREEAPERMRDRFGGFDQNGDGFIDRAEIDAMRNRFRSGGGRRSGDGARPEGGEGGRDPARGPRRPPE